jgi:hypothetical protein
MGAVTNPMRTYYDKVLDILMKNSAARDSDMALWFLVCEQVLPTVGIGAMTVKEFMRLVHTKVLPNQETIARVRRKVQSDNPETRGARHEQRWAEEIETATQIVAIGTENIETSKKLTMLQDKLELEPVGHDEVPKGEVELQVKYAYRGRSRTKTVRRQL